MRTRRLVVLVAALSALLLPSFGPAAGQVLQTPAPLAISDNVQVVGNVPGSLFACTSRATTATQPGTTGLTVFDLSEAADPKVVGALPLPHFENEEVLWSVGGGGAAGYKLMTKARSRTSILGRPSSTERSPGARMIPRPP